MILCCALVLIIGALYSNFETISGEIVQYNLIEGLPDILLSRDSEKIGHTWQSGNVWEKHLIKKFYDLLAAKNEPIVIFDIGAQTGCFTLLSKFLPHSQWYSFEPINEAALLLRENIKLNNINNAKVFAVAAAEKTGTVILKMPSMDAWGLSTIGSKPRRFNQVFYEREIESIDLDSFIEKNGISKVHFLKLDTEGSELLILKGARKLIQRDLPIILMEYNETNMNQCDIQKAQVDAFLQEMGYVFELISTEDILCCPVYPC